MTPDQGHGTNSTAPWDLPASIGLSARDGTRFVTETNSVEPDDFDAVVIPVFADGSIPPTLPLPTSRLRELPQIARRFDLGKPGDAIWVPGLIAPQTDALLVTVGTSHSRPVTNEAIRLAASTAARRTRTRSTVLCLLGSTRQDHQGEALAEHWLLGCYEHTAYLSAQAGKRARTVVLWGCDAGEVERGRLLADVTNYTRDLTNASAGDLTPIEFESECRRVATAFDLGVHVLDETELASDGFGGLTAVGCGSDNPPRLIELRHEPVPGAFVALVGKGITYDAGGLSIKDNDGMVSMKSDMAGAASVLAAIMAIAAMGCPINVRAYLACAENAVGPRSTRPGDVCRLRDGTTVELNNMDAEGRLVLADAMAFAKERGASSLVDIATLTWGSGLGPEIFAVLGTDDGLVRSVLDAASESGEPAWQLPLWEGYKSSLESSVADLKNFGPHSDKPFITLTGGLFLQRFAGTTPWAHLDIATTVMRERSTEWSAAGASGVGVRTLVRLLLGSSQAGPSDGDGVRQGDDT